MELRLYFHGPRADPSIGIDVDVKLEKIKKARGLELTDIYTTV